MCLSYAHLKEGRKSFQISLSIECIFMMQEPEWHHMYAGASAKEMRPLQLSPTSQGFILDLGVGVWVGAGILLARVREGLMVVE